MGDDVLINKAATIERCVARAREEFAADPAGFATNFTRQDAAILNVQRACEAALDMGMHIIRRERLGMTQSARDTFSLLEHAHWITAPVAEHMRRMVGFRNVAVHDYQALQLPIILNILTQHLDEFLEFSRQMLKGDAA
jgi:uncharacterized protein YutE (UPF0331/DUF86 family)